MPPPKPANAATAAPPAAENGAQPSRLHIKRLQAGRLLSVLLLLPFTLQADPLKITGSSTVTPVVTEAAEVLRERDGIRIHVDSQGGSSGGISSVAEGAADLGMSSKPLTREDRRKWPKAEFKTHQIGADAVALAVSSDVWNGGIRSLTLEQARALYEGKIQNWKELGGPDRRVVFFNKEPGRGTWEVFAKALYGSGDDAPLVSHPEVGSNEETRSKTASTPGAITQLSVAWIDGGKIHGLALENANGELVAPTNENIRSGRYLMSRPLLLLTNGALTPEAKKLLDFLQMAEGQALVKKHGYLPVSQASSL